MHRSPYATSCWPAKANQAGGPPGPDSGWQWLPRMQNASVSVSPAWTSACVLYPPAIPTTSLPPLEIPSATPATPGLAAWLFGGLAASLLRWRLGCLPHTPVELHMPRKVPPPWAWEWESWNAAKGDPGREAWKARSSADESGFQCISAGTSPPGLSTPGWEGTATGGQFKRSIAQGADSPCRICPQGSTCVPAPVSRPVGVPPLPCPFPSPMRQILETRTWTYLTSARYLPRYVARTPPVPETSVPMQLNTCASQVPFESPVLASFSEHTSTHCH